MVPVPPLQNPRAGISRAPEADSSRISRAGSPETSVPRLSSPPSREFTDPGGRRLQDLPVRKPGDLWGARLSGTLRA
ncbi:MAG: hypothetical protein LBT40_11200 [Deltaproteobacteria bacterium]|nr:hypothetical protein [Deltaproteobacteria bacterium]